MAYAHALIENPEDGTKYQRGDKVPKSVPGYDELVEAGSISDEEYVPEPTEVPDANLQSVVEIDENFLALFQGCGIADKLAGW